MWNYKCRGGGRGKSVACITAVSSSSSLAPPSSAVAADVRRLCHIRHLTDPSTLNSSNQTGSPSLVAGVLARGSATVRERSRGHAATTRRRGLSPLGRRDEGRLVAPGIADIGQSRSDLFVVQRVLKGKHGACGSDLFAADGYRAAAAIEDQPDDAVGRPPSPNRNRPAADMWRRSRWPGGRRRNWR